MTSNSLIAHLSSDIGIKAVLAIMSVALGWMGSTVAGWWKSRDKYQAHVTWQTTETQHGPESMVVIVIQSIHTLPINVTRLRVRNGIRMKTHAWPFDSEDPDYPDLPLKIGPMETSRLWLNSHALTEAAEQSSMLNWLWIPRVYIGVETMGRGERLFAAEGGLDWNFRRKRYRR